MLSRAQIKYIRSLTKQKFRNESKLFIAEGEKIVLEWLKSRERINIIIGTSEWLTKYAKLVSMHAEATCHIVDESTLSELSALKTPNQVMLVIPIPEPSPIPMNDNWYLALDGIQDPGNMGTIIRIADWFGIRSIICSPGCADIYNPKVVQSAMGGHLRVTVYESNLVPFLESIPIPKIAATLDGRSAYGFERMKKGILIIGNESKGVSEAVLEAATDRITIPGRGGAESLNAGVSAGILCALLLPC